MSSYDTYKQCVQLLIRALLSDVSMVTQEDQRTTYYVNGHMFFKALWLSTSYYISVCFANALQIVFKRTPFDMRLDAVIIYLPDELIVHQHLCTHQCYSSLQVQGYQQTKCRHQYWIWVCFRFWDYWWYLASGAPLIKFNPSMNE